MKKLLLLSALLILACSSDDSNDNNDNNNSNQTFLEKYDGIIWEDIGFAQYWNFLRFNNDLSNWYTIYDPSTTADVVCNNIGDEIDLYDLLNPENPLGYYVLMTNSEDVFQYNIYLRDENGVPQLYVRYIFTVTDNGNTLDFVEQFPPGGEGTATTTFQRASNELNDFADIPFPCN